ncbi:MAG: hypothetical protein AB7U75_02015 [Hyphomicrobiaceae bacterium]
MSREEVKHLEPKFRGASSGTVLLTPFFAVSGLLLMMVLIYLGYDFAQTRATPCEAIFKQTSIGLSTKISFLKTEGEVTIGREPLIELGERAQMAALNLKTCCTVLDAGRLNPEQFLQCKAKARAYDSKLEEISAVVARSVSSTQSTSSHGTDTGGDEKTQPTIPVEEARRRLAEAVQAARGISQDFNREVVEVRKAQALESLELEAPKEVAVSAQENEPNNDNLNTNAISLEKWVSASIGAAKDADVFAFRAPPTYRDWIAITLDNRSTTLEPRIELFSADKASLGHHHNTTPGSNLEYRFVSEPSTRYLVRISNYYGESVGGYLLEIRPSKTYDKHEPNDEVLSARSISPNAEIEAGIMDGKDHDFYRVEAPDGAKAMEVTLVNASKTLRPRIDVFGDDKVHLTHNHNTTAGADLSLSLPVKQGKAFRVEVSDYYGDAAGAYKLTVAFSN